MTITQFTMEEVRCFAGRQAFEIRPLTFLVGENSTGKTTALACFQVLANYLKSGEVDFNAHPYSMGIFKEIVRRSMKTDKSFGLSFTMETDSEKAKCLVEFSEKEGGFEPTIKKVSMRFTDGEIVFKNAGVVETAQRLAVKVTKGNQFSSDVPSHVLERLPPFSIVSGLVGRGFEGEPNEYSKLAEFMEDKTAIGNRLFGWMGIEGIFAFSSSPVRSRPKRTYDPTREFDDPEGSDVPMRLMRIKATREKEWALLKKQLEDFGERSGLFQNIEINSLGGSIGAPFQLRFKVRGPNSNIVDVGYGISQILPILVQVMDHSTSRSDRYSKSESAVFLLQQPEVHLHPRAQAELSSLLARHASKNRQSFIVETHSDNMVDRARIEIMRGNINADDVSLIYLEPKKNVVKVHNITFDKMGNMIGVPPHFRDFFLLESDRLMGFVD